MWPARWLWRDADSTWAAWCPVHRALGCQKLPPVPLTNPCFKARIKNRAQVATQAPAPHSRTVYSCQDPCGLKPLGLSTPQLCEQPNSETSRMSLGTCPAHVTLAGTLYPGTRWVMPCPAGVQDGRCSLGCDTQHCCPVIHSFFSAIIFPKSFYPSIC